MYNFVVMRRGHRGAWSPHGYVLRETDEKKIPKGKNLGRIQMNGLGNVESIRLYTNAFDSKEMKDAAVKFLKGRYKISPYTIKWVFKKKL